MAKIGSIINRWIPPIICLLLIGGTFTAGQLLFKYVDLRPHVEPYFFFSEKDPAYQADLEIKKIFPEPEQIIVAVKGPLTTSEYQENLEKMSYDFLGLPPIYAVQSLVLGPKDAKAAFKSPLWQRLLLTKEGNASLLILYSHKVPAEEIYGQIEKIATHYEKPDFQPVISGAPYVIDLIRRYLLLDLQKFSLTALLIFTLMTLVIFRSVRILLGTLVACANASAITLFLAGSLGIRMGPLTGNLSTIVFVLTLSHIAYMTFNWKHSLENPEDIPRHAVLHAIHVTIIPSFWSMLTTLLGFTTLIFVEAAPFQKLGFSGAMGTAIAFISAYSLFPWFLAWRGRQAQAELPTAVPKTKIITDYLSQKHPMITTLVFCIVIASAFGLHKIERDPHLLSYFKSGTELRDGLDYIDENWGSSPLKIVIRDEDGLPFSSDKTYEKLWDLQETLEKYPQVGNVVSLPLIMDEAKSRSRLTFLLRWERILNELEKPEHGEFIQQFVTADREQSLLLLRMKSLERELPRMTIVDHLKTTIWAKGFRAEMIGGLYLLQGEMAKVVIESLLTGLGMLIVLFFIMGLLLSRSIHITGAMFLSLLIIPVWLLGTLGYLKVPLDMISAPAANLAIAMGVDAMIHLLIMVRRCHRERLSDWEGWVEARTRLWKPILTSMTLVCTGFAIFTLSYFPPTQRFGISVISGSAMAAIAALFILPTLAGTQRNLSQKPSSPS